MVPDDFAFDPADFNRRFGLGDDPDRAVLASDAQFLWPLAHQLVTGSEGQLGEFRPGAPATGRREWQKLGRTILHQRLIPLISAGLVTKSAVRIEPHFRVENPLFTWKAGEPPPDGVELSARIGEAWTRSTSKGHHPTPPSVVYRITDRGAALMGAFRGRRNSAELKRHGIRCASLTCKRHAIGIPGDADARSCQSIAEIFVTRFWKSPDSVRGWRLLHRTPTELLVPDAVVYETAGTLSHAVVYATNWCGCLVNRFHRLCSAREIPYQLYGG
jgi:hypothetical protein